MAGRIAYYGGIVTNGLVLDLDAAKRDSYPGSGTTWNDISGNVNKGTLTNGPTFDTGSGGSLVFDGVDDYVEINLDVTSINSSKTFISLDMEAISARRSLFVINPNQTMNDKFESSFLYKR